MVVCAPNAFKGALSAADAAAAMATGVREAGFVAVEVPVADGGDGTLDVLLASAVAPRVDVVRVTGPLGAPLDARLGWLAPGQAVVEMAEAAGLRLVPPADRDALGATTHGVGELIRAALDGGARRVVVGVGGSATTDGGSGALAALGVRFLDARGEKLPPGGGALRWLANVDARGLDPRVRECRIEVAVDVRSPLLGPAGAAAVFGPQKGALPEEWGLLETGLARFVAVLDELAAVGAGGTDAERRAGWASAIAAQPGAGAAGGCAFGLAAVCGATLVPGGALVCDLVGLDAALDGAALVLTGEGRLDSSTAAGKAPAEVARRAAVAGLPCVALTGSVEQPAPPAYAEAVAIGEGLPLEEAMARTPELLRAAAAAVVGHRLG